MGPGFRNFRSGNAELPSLAAFCFECLEPIMNCRGILRQFGTNLPPLGLFLCSPPGFAQSLRSESDSQRDKSLLAFPMKLQSRSRIRAFPNSLILAIPTSEKYMDADENKPELALNDNSDDAFSGSVGEFADLEPATGIEMPEACELKTVEQQNEQPLTGYALVADMMRRQDEVIAQIDELNLRIEAAIKEISEARKAEIAAENEASAAILEPTAAENGPEPVEEAENENLERAA